ncbi:unnamed protein product [Sphagnum balticum]
MYVRISLDAVSVSQFSDSDGIIHTWNNQFNLGYPVASASFLISHGRDLRSSPCPSGYAHVKCSLAVDRVFASVSSSLRVLRRRVSNYTVRLRKRCTYSSNPASSANSASSLLMLTRVPSDVPTFVVDVNELPSWPLV